MVEWKEVVLSLLGALVVRGTTSPVDLLRSVLVLRVRSSPVRGNGFEVSVARRNRTTSSLRGV